MAVDGHRPWRLFIALPVPPREAEVVHASLASYRRAYPDARWTSPDAYHVTLCFLGNVDPDRIGTVREAMVVAAGTVRPFQVVVGAGDGIHRRSGGVVWLKLDRGEHEASRLSDRIDAALVPGLPSGRSQDSPSRQRPRPHLTIARRAESALIGALGSRALGQVAVDWAADHMVLFRSHTGTAAGSRYLALADVAL